MTLLRCIATAVFTLICVYALLRFFDVGKITGIMAASNYRGILLGAVIAAVTINLRGLRLCLCVSGRLVSPLMPTAYIFNALSALLPAKLGEVSLPLLLRRHENTSISMGVGVLLLLRILDLLSLLLIGSLVAAAALHKSDAIPSWIALAIAASSLLIIVALIVTGPSVARMMQRHGSSKHVLTRLASRLASPVAAMTRPRLAQLAGFSLAIWVSLFASFVILGRAILSQAGVFELATAGAAASLAFAVPATAIANVGPFQAAWVWTLASFGYALDPALACALLVHGVIFVVSMVFGAVGYATLARTRVH